MGIKLYAVRDAAVFKPVTRKLVLRLEHRGIVNNRTGSPIRSTDSLRGM